MEVVYPYTSRTLYHIFNSKDISKITKNTIGVHWYAGHPLVEKYVNTITSENFLTLRNVLGIIIRKALNNV